MKRFVILMAALLALALFPTAPIHAQSFANVPSPNFIPFGAGITADDTTVAMYVKYVGSSPGASTDIAVAANGDMTFRKGAVAVDEFECPVSGGLGGVIVVANAACDTMGEVVDVINKSTSWRAVLVAALRADSSNDTLLTISATDATLRTGLALKIDTDVAFWTGLAIEPPGANGICAYIACSGNAPGGMWTYPFVGYQGAAALARATSTYGSGTSTIKFYSVSVKNATGGSASDVTTLWSIAAGNTTVEKLLDYSETPIYARQGEKMLVRVENSAAQASATMQVYGALYKNP